MGIVIPRGKIRPVMLVAVCAASLSAASPAIQDINGVPRSPLKPDGKASVLFFVTSDCPISNSYAPEIQRICSEYGPKQVSCNLVYVDPDLTLADVKKHVKEFGYSGVPAILDTTQKLVEAAGAKTTPEAVVFSPSGQVLYRGRIDNVYAALGKRRPAATEKDLRKALDEVLSGKPVSTPETKAIGCYIPPVGVK
jgi:thiol-disulfide isomerase/thioredoxin